MRAKLVCAPMILLLLTLTACGSPVASHDDALSLAIRTEYLSMTNCQGTMEVTADYGQRVYEYELEFTWQKDGELVLTVVKPEELAGIIAREKDGNTWLEYDDVRLETGPLTPDGLSPVDSFPALLTYATEGYMADCCTEQLEEQDCLRIDFRDPDGSPGVGTEGTLWFDKETHALVRGEISSNGYTVVTCKFLQFTFT